MSEKTNNSASQQNNLLKWLSLSILSLSLLIAVGVRVRLLDFPLERDEGEYAYAGQLILEGIPPYQLACNMKMPGTYLAYAIVMSVCGQTPAGIHLGLLGVHLATLAVLFLVARKYLDLYGAVIATSAYALMTLSAAYLGLAAHATHFVVLPALLGIWMLFRIETNGRLPACFASGCFFGVAFLMKQPAMFFGLFGGLYLAWISLTGKTNWRQLFILLGIYSFGCLLPFLAVCLWLKIAGVFPQFWFWTISYASEYANLLPISEGFKRADEAISGIISAAPLLWIIAGSGLACLWHDTRMPWRMRVFLGGFLIFSFLAVCPGLYFRQHYFIVLVPAIALLIGLAVSFASRWLVEKYPSSWMHSLPVLVAAVGCAQSLYADRAVLFSLSPREACRAVYAENPFPESLEIARYIKQNSSKAHRIVVVGSEPQIYFYAHRHSSTKHIYTYPLMETQPFAPAMQEDMIREIEQNPPEYLVFVVMPFSWLAQPGSSHLLVDWVAGYVKQNMEPVGVINFTVPQTPEAIWGNENATNVLSSLSSQNHIAIYKRTAR